MSVQLTQFPDRVNLTGNPIIIGIHNPDGIIEVPGTKAILNMTFGSTAKHLDSFQLTFGTLILTFTFSETPNDSTEQLPLRGGLEISEYFNIIYNTFRSHYYISKYYDLSLNSYEIQFNAKNVGEQYNLQLINNFGNNASILTTISGTNSIIKENYQILLQTYATINDEEKLIREDLLNTDTNGLLTTNIQDYFNPYFVSNLDYPEKPGLNLFSKLESAVIPFRLCIGEKYNGLIKNVIPIEEYFYAINGGLTNDDFNFYKKYNSNYFDYSENKYNFLTWQPKHKIVDVNQPERLFYFTYATEALTVSCKIYYTNNTDFTFNIVEEQEVTPYSIYQIYSGHNSLELKSYNPEKKILKYEIFVTNATCTITESIPDPKITTQSLNTGWDGANGMLPEMGKDPRWAVAIGSPTHFSPITAGVSQAFVGKMDQAWVNSPFGNAQWISPYQWGRHAGHRDFLFSTKFYITEIDPANLEITLHFFADNCVQEVYLNYHAQSLNYPEILPQTIYDPYNYYGFNTQGKQVNIVLKNCFQTGENLLAVWVKSGGGVVGFLCQGMNVTVTNQQPIYVKTYSYDKMSEKKHLLLIVMITLRNDFSTLKILSANGTASDVQVKKINSVDVNRTSANILSDYTYDNIDIDSSIKQTIETNTGWTDFLSTDSKEYINYLREFLLSKNIYEIKGDFLIPIKLLTTKADLHSTKNDIYNLSFSYIHTSTDSFFSNEIGIEDIHFLVDDMGEPLSDNNKVPLIF